MKFINLLISSLLLLTSHAYGDAVIFSGNDVKTLKPNIDLYGQGKILSGSTDPTSVATSAPVGSIYLNTSNGNLYRKVDAGSSTNWQKVGSAAVAGNLLPNPDWETGTAGWTASAGSYARTTTAADVGFGAGSGSFDASAASQTLTSTAVAIPTGLYASNGLASCYIKTAASDYLMQVYDGTNVIGSATIAASTQYTRTNVNFIFPSSGNISLRISSQSNAAIMYMDDCYVGPATNISQVSQAQMYGQVRITGCSATFDRTANTYGDTTTPTGCVYTTSGNALAPTTNLPAVRFTNLPPGEYYFVYNGIYGRSVAAAYDPAFRFSDGTNNANEEASVSASGTLVGYNTTFSGRIQYSTAQSDVTIRVQIKSNGTNTGSIYGVTGYPGTITVYRFPSSSELAVRSDQIDQIIRVSTSATTSIADSTPTDIVFNTVSEDTAGGYNNATGEMTVAFASRCTITGDLGITYSGAGQVAALIYVDRGAGSAREFDGGGGCSTNSSSICQSPFSFSSTFKKGDKVKVRIYNGTGGTRALSGTASMNRVEMRCTNGAVAPILVGSVTSSSAGAERVERANVVNNGTNCVITQSGTWVSSATRGSTGICNLNITSGIFSGTPSCVMTQYGDGGVRINSISSSLIQTGTTNTAWTYTDRTFDIICQGPR